MLPGDADADDLNEEQGQQLQYRQESNQEIALRLAGLHQPQDTAGPDCQLADAIDNAVDHRAIEAGQNVCQPATETTHRVDHTVDNRPVEPGSGP